MKLYVSMALVAICLIATVNAQEIVHKKYVNIGLKAGLNLYNIESDNQKSDMKAGIHAGLIGHIHLARQLALQPELVYSVQGAKSTSNGVTTKLNLGYINVPVMLQYMFDNGFRLQAGPQVGFLINAKSKTNNVSIDVKDDLNKLDFSIGAGVGYVEPTSGFGIDARYNLGLTDITKSTITKATNRGFQIGVFYLINHK